MLIWILSWTKYPIDFVSLVHVVCVSCSTRKMYTPALWTTAVLTDYPSPTKNPICQGSDGGHIPLFSKFKTMCQDMTNIITTGPSWGALVCAHHFEGLASADWPYHCFLEQRSWAVHHNWHGLRWDPGVVEMRKIVRGRTGLAWLAMLWGMVASWCQ